MKLVEIKIGNERQSHTMSKLANQGSFYIELRNGAEIVRINMDHEIFGRLIDNIKSFAESEGVN